MAVEIRLRSVDELMSALPVGARIVASPGCGAPTTILESLDRIAEPTQQLSLYSGLQLSYPYIDAVKTGRLKYSTWHVMPEIRDLVDNNSVSYIPARASEVPSLLKQWQIDTAFLRVSPPDQNGLVSLGPTGSYPIEAALTCATIIAEIDENVPFTIGNQFPASRITYFVESTSSMAIYNLGQPTPVSSQIANTVLEMIPDGATLQIGIGAIPEAITEAISQSDRKRLRFVGMGSDTMIEIAELGKLASDKDFAAIFAVELMGTSKIMKFAHNNPLVNVVSSLRGHSVNLLSSIPLFHSINSAVEVDLTGQINAESVGKRQISGVGGSADYIETAYQSNGGRRITVLQSTAKGSTKSSIVPQLGFGSTVSIPRSLAEIVVTEFGAVDLRGKNVRERASALISIAHPDFRESLEQQLDT